MHDRIENGQQLPQLLIQPGQFVTQPAPVGFNPLPHSIQGRDPGDAARLPASPSLRCVASARPPILASGASGIS